MCILHVLLILSISKICTSGSTDSFASRVEHTSNTCSSEEGCTSCSWSCSWSVPESNQFIYSLSELCTREFDAPLSKPQGAHILFKLCEDTIPCNDIKTGSCIIVPGVKPASTGKLSVIESIQENAAAYGFKLIHDNGEICDVTKKPRKTIIIFPCDPSHVIHPTEMSPLKVYEGEKKFICHYYIEFPSSQYGCPHLQHVGQLLEKTTIIIQAVAGCVNSDPIKSTSSCHYFGGQTISLIGLGFSYLCNSNSHELAIDRTQCTQYIQTQYCILVGDSLCTTPTMVSPYIINCTLGPGTGEGLSVKILKKSGSGECSSDPILAILPNAVSYRHVINFKDKFSQFVDYGVGGLKKEIEELYRRAFASRGAAPEVLARLGISHVKGILLYGPPGAGKTLLARAIAKMLGSKQAKLINGPEIISKYLGESERNLRGYFQDALDAYSKNGDASELYVIIIDEIEAICKPRGKSDLSAAGAAYDSLVNQLLTLMDGLTEVNNLLVIGMTNRRELMDSALLRPGRFEVQIEIGLPDEEGREEIFEIHTRSMRESGSLSFDVSCKELAANTTRFSGAEIAAVVRTASSYAIERQYSSDVVQSLLVTSDDFKKALQTIVPEYTHSETHVLSKYSPPVFLSLGPAHESIISSLLNIIHSLKETSKLQTALIYGLKGTGKTSLAARVAVLGRFSFVKIITATNMIGLNDFSKVDLLHQTFKDAFDSDLSLIVLDDLHRLVEYISIGDHISVSHVVMHTVFTLLSTPPPPDSHVLVIGTLNVANKESLFQIHNLNFASLFRTKQIRKLGGGQFSLPNQLSVPVSQLLYSIECVCMSQTNEEDINSCYYNSYIPQSTLIDCLTE